jgi:CDP-glucose 4,6-dehydratase
MVRAAEKGEEVHIRNPYATRPWQHVLEPLSGYLAVGQRLLLGETSFSDAWNFGPGDHANLSVEEVLQASQSHWNKIRYIVETLGTQPHEAHLLHLDSTKARRKLKWKNIWDHNDAFARTIEWYRSYYEDEKILTELDLEAFIQKARLLEADWAKASKV